LIVNYRMISWCNSVARRGFACRQISGEQKPSDNIELSEILLICAHYLKLCVHILPHLTIFCDIFSDALSMSNNIAPNARMTGK
jgi:hypothetical protein